MFRICDGFGEIREESDPAERFTGIQTPLPFALVSKAGP